MEENKEFKENEGIESNETNNNIQNNNQDLIPAKSNKGLVIGLIILVILLAGGLAYMLFFNKDKEEPKKNDNNNSSTATPAPIEDNVTPTPIPQEENDADKKYELTIYKDADSGQINLYYTKQSESAVEAFKIKTNNSDAKALDIDEDSLFIIFKDDGIKIYDIKNKSIRSTSLDDTYADYEALVNEKRTGLIGIGFRDKDSYVGYYNVDLGKKLYYSSKKYKQDDSMYIWQLDDKYFVIESEEGPTYLLNASQEKIELSTDEPLGGYLMQKYNDDRIYMSVSGDDTFTINKIYDKNLKEIYNKKIEENNFNYYKGFIYIADKNVIKKYNSSGALINTSDEYGTIEKIINDYVLYIKDNELILTNIEDSSKTKVITTVTKDYYIDTSFSSYYSREYLDEIDEKNKKEGIYIVVYYSESGEIKDSKGNYGMEYCYTSDKQLIEYPIKHEMGGRAKPVLYLYPEKETNVTVKFEKPNLLTTTYPKYINSWNVTVKPNGDMKDSDGKYYYALYWDEKRYNEVDFHEGFYVEGKDAISFLEEKLSIIGLNDKERNEFIMYWLPIMEANGKNLVYFELTEERELGNKLIISPKPDSLLRVSIHIKKVNEKVNIKEQKLPTFSRHGFTAVEWGGMTY